MIRGCTQIKNRNEVKDIGITIFEANFEKHHGKLVQMGDMNEFIQLVKIIKVQFVFRTSTYTTQGQTEVNGWEYDDNDELPRETEKLYKELIRNYNNKVKKINYDIPIYEEYFALHDNNVFSCKIPTNDEFHEMGIYVDPRKFIEDMENENIELSGVYMEKLVDKNKTK